MMAQSGFDAEEELYEYDAPSQVVDLKELQNAEVDDKWFGMFSFEHFDIAVGFCGFGLISHMSAFGKGHCATTKDKST